MPKTLLLADDSKTIQQAVSMTFAREDLQVSTVDNGEAALQAAKQSKPDVILADVSMPRMGGYELCQRIRADAALKDVPVLLLGGPTPIDPAKAMAVGANGHMPKPFDSTKLIEHVKTILANPKAKPAMTAAATSGPPRPGAPTAAPARPPAPPPPAKPAVSPGAGGTMVMARPPMPASAAARPAAPPAPRPPPAAAARPATTPAPPAAARPPAPGSAPRPPAPATTKPLAAPPPRPSAPPAKPPAAARPPAPPVPDDDEDIPLDVDEVEDAEAPAPTPLRPVAPSAHKPALSVVPPPADGGEAQLREALSKASREVIEKIAWEVVPELAETIIREELERLIKERGA
jgi:CheY-like chemotaxis protein